MRLLLRQFRRSSNHFILDALSCNTNCLVAGRGSRPDTGISPALRKRRAAPATVIGHDVSILKRLRAAIPRRGV
jgi:hypothetical protein